MHHSFSLTSWLIVRLAVTGYTPAFSVVAQMQERPGTVADFCVTVHAPHQK